MTQATLRDSDPFEGLYHYQVRSILTMRPTWSERWRMAGPMSAETRRDVLTAILMERRRDYLVWYEQSKVLAKISRDEDRFGWQQRKAELQDRLATAHYIAERQLMIARMKAEGREKAVFYERKLNNGQTLAEVRARRKEEASYLHNIISAAPDHHAERGR